MNEAEFLSCCRLTSLSIQVGWRNNAGGPVPDKLAFQSSHKFVIAFEKLLLPGLHYGKVRRSRCVECNPYLLGDPQIASLIIRLL